MNTTMVFKSLICGALLGGLCAFAHSESHELKRELKIAYADVESFPYFMQRSENIPDDPGVSVEIIQMACKELGITIILSRQPGKRVLRSLGTKSIDGAFLFSYKKERAQSAAYPLINGKANAAFKMDTISYHFYTLKGSGVTWQNRHLKGANLVGVNLGYAVISDIKSMNIPVVEVSSTIESLNILLNERVPVVAAQEYPFERNWGKHRDLIEKLLPAIRTKDYFFIFNRDFYKDNREFSKQFWEKIKEVSQREYPSLIEKYLSL